MRLAVMIAILAGSGAYMALSSMPLFKDHPRLVWCAFGCSVTAIALYRILRHMGLAVPFLYPASYILLGLVSTYAVYLLLADIVQLALRLAFGMPAGVRLWALKAAVLATVLSTGIGTLQALIPPKVRRVEVPISGLPEGLQGFSIAQISDLHIDSMVSKGSLEILVRRVNALDANLIALTGDIVDGPVGGLLPKASVLGGLMAKNGVCFVTGNHEYYTGDLEGWLGTFRRMGWEVLMDSSVTVERGGSSLAVVGLADRGRRGGGVEPEPNLEVALNRVPKAAKKILLIHQPIHCAEAEGLGFDLMLAGHTHGGQYFPWSCVIPLLYDYPAGLRKHGGMWVYTTTGAGFWGPPNRFLRPKEIVLLVLADAK